MYTIFVAHVINIQQLRRKLRWQCHSSFMTPKISAKFPQMWRQIQVKWVKIGDFRPISRYISNGARHGHSYNGRLIAIRTRYFQ